MIAKTKKEYLDNWNEHIQELSLLYSVKNSERFNSAINTLCDIVKEKAESIYGNDTNITEELNHCPNCGAKNLIGRRDFEDNRIIKCSSCGWSIPQGKMI